MGQRTQSSSRRTAWLLLAVVGPSLAGCHHRDEPPEDVAVHHAVSMAAEGAAGAIEEARDDSPVDTMGTAHGDVPDLESGDDTPDSIADGLEGATTDTAGGDAGALACSGPGAYVCDDHDDCTLDRCIGGTCTSVSMGPECSVSPCGPCPTSLGFA